MLCYVTFHLHFQSSQYWLLYSLLTNLGSSLQHYQIQLE